MTDPLELLLLGVRLEAVVEVESLEYLFTLFPESLLPEAGLQHRISHIQLGFRTRVFWPQGDQTYDLKPQKADNGFPLPWFY